MKQCQFDIKRPNNLRFAKYRLHWNVGTVTTMTLFLTTVILFLKIKKIFTVVKKDFTVVKKDFTPLLHNIVKFFLTDARNGFVFKGVC